MAYLAGKMVLAMETGAPGGGSGERAAGPVRVARFRGRSYPYVPARAVRRWTRQTMVELGAVLSPVTRVGTGGTGSTGSTGGRVGCARLRTPLATTEADPMWYVDDDLFGYPRAGSREDDTPTTLRDGPFMLGTLMSVEPAFRSHEFLTAELAAPFLLDVPRIGTFTLPDAAGAARRTECSGEPNYSSEEAATRLAEAAAAGAVATRFREQSALRLPLAERRSRAALLLEALAQLSGGAERAPYGGDRVPELIVLLPFNTGVNPLAHCVTGGPGSGARVRGDVLRAELAAWRGEWQAPVRIGWRPGFRDELRAEFMTECGPEIEAGTIVLDHPRTTLRGLAAELRDGRLDHWFDDPAR